MFRYGIVQQTADQLVLRRRRIPWGFIFGFPLGAMGVALLMGGWVELVLVPVDEAAPSVLVWAVMGLGQAFAIWGLVMASGKVSYRLPEKWVFDNAQGAIVVRDLNRPQNQHADHAVIPYSELKHVMVRRVRYATQKGRSFEFRHCVSLLLTDGSLFDLRAFGLNATSAEAMALQIRQFVRMDRISLADAQAQVPPNITITKGPRGMLYHWRNRNLWQFALISSILLAFGSLVLTIVHDVVSTNGPGGTGDRLAIVMLLGFLTVFVTLLALLLRYGFRQQLIGRYGLRIDLQTVAWGPMQGDSLAPETAYPTAAVVAVPCLCLGEDRSVEMELQVCDPEAWKAMHASRPDVW